MLNRRTLRIKIMQTLFAFEQCKEANLLLSQDFIESQFQPDLNSMEVQDKQLLTRQRKSAMQLLEKRFKGSDIKTSEDKAVEKAVKEAVDLYHKHVKKDYAHLQNNMVREVEKLNDLYHSVLGLLIAFADQAAADKKIDFKNFVKNEWIAALSKQVELNKELLKPGVGWEGRKEKVRSWFRDVVKTEATFQKFIEEKLPDIESQKNIVKHIARKLIFSKGPIHDYFEEDDIHWVEDKEILKSLVDKTIKSYKADSGKIELQKLSLDWEDDKDFMVRLFKTAAELGAEHKELIARNTKNWEVERLPLTDRVILDLAIAELITFQAIPVKVSINEYIELAKHYSTPKSRQFINGILDVIAKELMASGAVKKSGRGLLDNK